MAAARAALALVAARGAARPALGPPAAAVRPAARALAVLPVAAVVTAVTGRARRAMAVPVAVVTAVAVAVVTAVAIPIVAAIAVAVITIVTTAVVTVVTAASATAVVAAATAATIATASAAAAALVLLLLVALAARAVGLLLEQVPAQGLRDAHEVHKVALVAALAHAVVELAAACLAEVGHGRELRGQHAAGVEAAVHLLQSRGGGLLVGEFHVDVACATQACQHNRAERGATAERGGEGKSTAHVPTKWSPRLSQTFMASTSPNVASSSNTSS